MNKFEKEHQGDIITWLTKYTDHKKLISCIKEQEKLEEIKMLSKKNKCCFIIATYPRINKKYIIAYFDKKWKITNTSDLTLIEKLCSKKNVEPLNKNKIKKLLMDNKIDKIYWTIPK